MVQVLTSLAHHCLRFIYPTYCCNCGKLGEYVCAQCYELLHFTHQQIRLELEPLYLDSAQAVTEYAPPISKLIQALKYHSVKGISRWCGELIYMTSFLPTVDYITSVPLHPQRQDQRGFNQAEEIAITLAELSDIPYIQTLERVKYTPPQAQTQSQIERKSQLHHIFKLRSEIEKYTFNQKSFLLIDDVVTTGATLNECAEVLKKAGCDKVFGLALAHGS